MRKGIIAALGLTVSIGLTAMAWGAEKSVSGTLEDSFCYATMGAHGAGHKKCAQACARKGIPVSLVENGSGTMYVLIPPKNDEAIPDSVISRMEDSVTITGDEYVKGGVHYLTVKSVK
ncbi:MAG TPA: hypothetical protein VJN94_07980 [Candidatus Binataceae bacterium]|nr:hypothetical protein [Candidatus Binataceae bacterium]